MDWPERLADALEFAQQARFSEVYYCAIFAADCVLAMTGEDPAVLYRHLSIAEAYKRAAASLREATTAALGPEMHVAFARRGDVILRTDGGQDAIGICIGAQSAFISSEGGLAFHPTLQQVTAWRVPFGE